MRRTALLLLPTLLLTGCVEEINKLLEDPKAVQKEADARAIGSACRYGLRSIEDCYVLNPKASKSAVFAGWKEMDQYMRDNKVEGVPAKIEVTPAATTPPAPKEEEIIEEKPAKKKASSGH
ncbi:hypothetical protein RQP54_15375 [Curvibacter sp. APW13]|uniref:hypothetical protein n=1 Tax=Curvibacter sp. APW13 TaxID=3077236 RepID=UPI0028DF22F6|nr:hypothetical protein [Curvibacter sp. APW13]MDT8992252.1 hypothetical protein [Curvibacter sp. APW13]